VNRRSVPHKTPGKRTSTDGHMQEAKRKTRMDEERELRKEESTNHSLTWGGRLGAGGEEYEWGGAGIQR